MLTLILFHHTPADCPLAQTTADTALNLCASLTEARKEAGHEIAGGFFPADHRGVALAEGTPHRLQALFSQVLSPPNHHIRTFPLPPRQFLLQTILDHPAMLDGDSLQAQAGRELLFAYADEYLPAAGYGRSLQDGTPHVSITDLETYLAANAPGRNAR